jgi:hypothetical protein
MHAKRVLTIAAALLMASQAYALTAYEKNHGCNHEVGDCPDQNGGGGGGGGGGGNDASSYTGAWVYEGSLWESFEDSQGGFDIETNLSTGQKTVHMGNVAAFLIKPPPPTNKMKRSGLAYGAMTPAQTLAQAKKKAAEAAAAAKAFQEKMAAQDAADNKAAADKAQAEAAVRSNRAGTGQSLTKAPQPQVSASSPQRKP